MSFDPLHPTLADALSRVCRFDARGPSEASLQRARELSRLLPAPAASGPRAWFDRAAAAIARLAFSESSGVTEGVRRLSGPQARGWTHGTLRFEIECEGVTAADGSARVTLHGQVEDSTGIATEGWPIAALDEDGQPIASALVERGGYFTLDVSSRVRDLAIGAVAGAVLLPSVVAVDEAPPPSASSEG